MKERIGRRSEIDGHFLNTMAYDQREEDKDLLQDLSSSISSYIQVPKHITKTLSIHNHENSRERSPQSLTPTIGNRDRSPSPWLQKFQMDPECLNGTAVQNGNHSGTTACTNPVQLARMVQDWY